MWPKPLESRRQYTRTRATRFPGDRRRAGSGRGGRGHAEAAISKFLAGSHSVAGVAKGLSGTAGFLEGPEVSTLVCSRRYLHRGASKRGNGSRLRVVQTGEKGVGMAGTRHQCRRLSLGLWATTVVATACGSSGPATTVPPVAVTSTTAVAKTTVLLPPTSTTAGMTAGVEGTVLFGPVCPVERIPPDPQCSPRPGAARIQVVRADGGVVAEGTAGLDGRFTIAVAPDTYDVTAVATAPGPGRSCQVDPPQVTVVAGSFVPVRVACDTGIR